MDARAHTVLERRAETRLQIDFRVPDAALARLLPTGWEADIATSGPAKDANLRLIVIDRMASATAEGKPVGRGGSRAAWLAIPVRRSGTDQTGQMIVAGLTDDPALVPGPFGTDRLAQQVEMRRSQTVSGAEAVRNEEHWRFTSADGELIEIDARFERAPAQRRSSTVRFHSPTDPAIAQAFRIEMGIDIMRNATVPMRDRVSDFRYRVAGGRLAALFDGSERVLSIDAFPWYDLTVMAP
jgi:hypothetical protein